MKMLQKIRRTLQISGWQQPEFTQKYQIVKQSFLHSGIPSLIFFSFSQ